MNTRIVAELGALSAELDALKRLQAEIAAKLDALLPALLDRAFKGKLKPLKVRGKFDSKKRLTL